MPAATVPSDFMPCPERWRFALRLLWQRKGRSALVILSVAVGSGVLLLFLSFAQGMQQAVLAPILAQASPTTLIVRPDYRAMAFLRSSGKLTETEITKVAALSGVKSVGRQLGLGFPNSLRISLFGLRLETDVPVFGVDALLAPAEVADFLAEGEPLPVLISPRLIDIFNTVFGESLPGGTRITEEFAQEKTFELVFGQSVFFKTLGKQEPIIRSAKIVGFSPKLPPVGLAIPLPLALRLNEELGGVAPQDAVYQQLLVEAESLEAVAPLENAIKAAGLSVQNFDELGREVRLLTTLIRLILLFAAAIILLIAFFTLFSLISLTLLEQRQNIGILRALGLSRWQVKQIFLSAAVFLVTTGVSIGLSCGKAAAFFLNSALRSALPELSFLPQDFFPMPLLLFFGIAAGVLLSALLFALIPTLNTLRQDPLRAIWST